MKPWPNSKNSQINSLKTKIHQLHYKCTLKYALLNKYSWIKYGIKVNNCKNSLTMKTKWELYRHPTQKQMEIFRFMSSHFGGSDLINYTFNYADVRQSNRKIRIVHLYSWVTSQCRCNNPFELTSGTTLLFCLLWKKNVIHRSKPHPHVCRVSVKCNDITPRWWILMRWQPNSYAYKWFYTLY